MMSDFLENIGIVTMIVNYPEELVTTAQVTNVFTLTKWALMVTTVITIMVGLASLLRREAGPGKRRA